MYPLIIIDVENNIKLYWTKKQANIMKSYILTNETIEIEEMDKRLYSNSSGEHHDFMTFLT